MGIVLATLGFEWNTPRMYSQAALPCRDSIQVEDIDDETLISQIVSMATENTYRQGNEIYRCDLYKGLDKRIPFSEDAKEQSVWRMKDDHPLVNVLVSEKGQQPIHIIEDTYGDLVIYEDSVVEEGISHLIVLCSQLGYEILNDPKD